MKVVKPLCFVTVSFFVSAMIFAQEYKNAEFLSGVLGITIEQNANKIAGSDGSYSYFTPSIKYKNSNYKAVGVKIESPDYGKLEIVHKIDTISNFVEKIEYIILDDERYDDISERDFIEFMSEVWSGTKFGLILDMSLEKMSSDIVVSTSEQYSGKRQTLDWYQDINVIKTKTRDNVPASVTVEVVFGHKQGDSVVIAELKNRLVEINDFLQMYFSKKNCG